MTLPKTKSCPRCKKSKSMDQFGTRKMKTTSYGKTITSIRPQSHCVSCRGLKPKSSRKKISKKGGKKK